MRLQKMKSWLNQFMLHLWYPTSAMILAWILEECLRYNTIYSNFIIVIVVTITIIIQCKAAGGWASKCMLFICV